MESEPTVIERQVVRIGDRGESRTVRIEIFRRPDEVEVTVVELDVQGAGFDLIAALDAVRSQVEDLGWLLCVQGARPNAQSSGMSRDMGGGETIYLLDYGLVARIRRRLRPNELPTLVRVLDEAAPSQVGTLAEQRDWGEQFVSRQA